MRGYAELHAWSNFTFLEGASHPEELIARAAELELAAIALTDRDGLYGAVRFASAARANKVAAIVGCECTYEDASRVVLLVENAGGYANLCELISIAQMRGAKRDARLRIDDFAGRTDGLIALSGGALPAETAVAQMREHFGERYYLELQHHLTDDDAERCERIVALARRLRVPYVATNAVAYAKKTDAQLGDVLACVKHKTDLVQARAEMLLRPNAEYHLKDARAMRRVFRAYPDAIEATLEIAARCAFRLERQTGQFPLFPVPEGTTRQRYLRELVAEGAAGRYGTPLPSNVERQLEYELGIIAKVDLAGYFLIVWDIVRAAAELGVLCQGRGSAANSAVCYALGITAVDPVGMDLLFERFMSEERQEIPDIDIDFAHEDREKVIQYVYERYGRSNAAMAAEVITYRTRSAIRDVGKALGLTLDQVDAVGREYDAHESLAGAMGVEAETDAHLTEAVRKRRDLDAGSNIYASRTQAHMIAPDPDPQIAPPVQGEIAERLYAFCRRIDGFPRHMGIHSGGMVITRDPLVRVAPVEWASMRDRTIIQWDKDDLQELGLIKIDLLGLGMLALLREAFSLHERVHKHELALHTIPADDPPTYAMMQQADTIGVFQIESRAQMSMLPRMKPTCFYDIVMQVAIIRPGPIQGQMVHPFLRRREGLEPVTYPHPKLKAVLERTMGVPLFQEQGMRLAIEAAGFSPGQADQLRRAMGHKRSHERMREIYPMLMDGMVRSGIDREAAEKLFGMLEGFADYGFPESHAASFALLAYASAYVKCHFPAIFAAAILNVQPMGFYSTEVLVNDAKRHGVKVKPIAVNASEYLSFVDPSGALQLGFHLVRGLGSGQTERLQAALGAGPFEDILAFAQRTKLEKDAMENLAVSGAFDPWFRSRREAMWALRALDEREARGELGKLMDVHEPKAEFGKVSPKLQTAFDLWSTGVTPGPQAIAHLRAALQKQNVLPASHLNAAPNHLVCKVGGMVITRQRPGTAKGFVFLTLEDETGLVNVIVRPDIYETYRRVIRSSSTLVVEGKLQKGSGCIDLIAINIHAFDDQGLTEGVRAHNFH
ncbi:MAG: DNA polymerase III subunit alpha [Candidatus Eremiobacteraeota bacterium]|nr:DNA polymerase III subunit alpha [Candidatus Eremiobacteraeota bacterium]